MGNTENFSILKTIKGKLPSLPLVNIKNYVLGKKYRLSLVFIGRDKSHSLNKKYRKKDKSTDILTFPLTHTEGEMFICIDIVKRDAKKFDMNYNQFISYLFIHGLLHLKGLTHGNKMEEDEKKLMKKFNI